MVVLCSENYAALAVLAACEPAIVLQTFGGARDPSDASTRATFEYAVRLNAVRRVIVCGHLACQAVALDEGANARTATQADVVAQCRSLREDSRIGALLRDHGVSLSPPVPEGPTFSGITGTRAPRRAKRRILGRGDDGQVGRSDR